MRAKRLLKSASWQHPAVRAVAPLVDLADRVVRRRRDLAGLPPWSARIRSSGARHEFGGTRYALVGQDFLVALLVHGRLDEGQTILDVGCGTGKLAHAIRRSGLDVSFVGVDPDRPSIQACLAVGFDNRFRFAHIDVAHPIYHPTGSIEGTRVVLPVDTGRVDVATLWSVWTHLPPEEIVAQAAELRRVLGDRGRLVFTAFLSDQGPQVGRRRFTESLPLPDGAGHYGVLAGGMAYPLGWLDMVLGDVGLKRVGDPTLGAWRGAGGQGALSQDLLVYSA